MTVNNKPGGDDTIFFNVLMWLSIIWIAPLICFLLRNDTKFKKNIVVGVTLPYEARSDQAISDRLNKFKLQELRVMIFLIAIAIPCVFITSFNLMFILWGAWLIPCIIIPYIPYAKCNKDLKRIKVERGWKRSMPGQSLIEVSLPNQKWMSPWGFVVPLVIALAPLIAQPELSIIYIIDALAIIIFFFIYRFLYQKKPEIVDDNLELSLALSQVRKRNWSLVWIVSAYCMALINIAFFVFKSSPEWQMVALLLLSFILCVFVIRVEINTRHIQEKLTTNSGQPVVIDEDDYWIWGIFYYNPHDSHGMINERIGVNVSLNMAKKSNQLIMGFIVLLLLIIPFIGPLSISLADKPTQLELVNNELIVSSGFKKYEISLASIETIELQDKLPDNLKRVMGTALPNLKKGHYSSPSTGNIELCINPTISAFIYLQTKENDKYLFNSKDLDYTITFYHDLEDAMQND